jgi:hypothetical protein
LTLVIKDSRGNVVSTTNGVLAGGNIESLRLVLWGRRNGWR